MSQKEKVLTLIIRHLEEKDTDIYTCDVGTAKSMAKVTVKGEKLGICKELKTSLSIPPQPDLTQRFNKCNFLLIPIG